MHAGASEHYDRRIKLELYARAGIPEVWFILVGEKSVEVFGQPGASGYREKTAYRAGDRVLSRSVLELALPVKKIFPE